MRIVEKTFINCPKASAFV